MGQGVKAKNVGEGGRGVEGQEGTGEKAGNLGCGGLASGRLAIPPLQARIPARILPHFPELQVPRIRVTIQLVFQGAR